MRQSPLYLRSVSTQRTGANMLQEAASSMRFSTPSSPINVPQSSADMHVSRHAVLCALVLFCFAACLVAVTGCASQPMATDEGTAGFPSTPSSQGTDAPEQSPSSPLRRVHLCRKSSRCRRGRRRQRSAAYHRGNGLVGQRWLRALRHAGYQDIASYLKSV